MKFAFKCVGLFVAAISISFNSLADSKSMLRNDVDALRNAVIDSYMYALVLEHKRTTVFKTFKDTSNSGYLSLCHSDQFSLISPEMLSHKCWIARTKVEKSCKDVDGCIVIEVDQSTKKHPEILNKLVEVIRDPCANIPREDKFHWIGFSYPNFVSYETLDCKINKVPYRKAIIIQGNEKVEIDAVPKR